APRRLSGTGSSFHLVESLGSNLCATEGGHDLAGEAAQLVGEFRGGEPFGPVNHEVFQPGILGLDRTDAVDHLAGRAAEPRLLLHAVADRRDPRGCARGAPDAALLVGVAHEAERREPLVALVVRRLAPPDRLFLAGGNVEPRAPDHVLAELLLP